MISSSKGFLTLMRKIWLIIKREYVTRVRTKGFVIATVALPSLTVALFVVSILIAMHEVDHTLNVAILDNNGDLAAASVRRAGAWRVACRGEIGAAGRLPGGSPRRGGRHTGGIPHQECR